MKKIFVFISLLFSMCSCVYALEGQSGNNIHKNNYEKYGLVETSNLWETDGQLQRVEFISGRVVIENYDYEGEIINSYKEIEAPLPVFGGFYSGENFNFLLFGANNLTESDDTEVIRLQKYSKNWELLKECSVYGSDTYAPFAAGSARMTEEKGLLYIYTCREMYKASDGKNHQRNTEYIIDIDTFGSPSRPFYPYSSHSFDQYIDCDGEYIYTIDLGDAYPREIMLSKYKSGSLSLGNIEYTTVLDIKGNTGDNYTGVSLGGMALSETDILVAGNTVTQDEDTFYSNTQRNIFLALVPKDMTTPSVTMLTNYDTDSGISPRTPYILKISENEYIVIWEEYSSSDYITKIAKVDASASVLATKEIKAPLSACRPILSETGKIFWYVTENTSPILYWLDPVTLESTKTVSEDWSYDETTATLTIGGKGFMTSQMPWEEYKNDCKNIVIEKGVYSISENAFEDYTALESISLPDTLITIGSSAFKGCILLESATLPKNVTKVQSSLFEGCTTLKSVIFLGDITEIGGNAFKECTALESVNIPDTLKSFGSYAFYNCASLKEINIPSSVSTIPSYCFYGCSSLKGVSFPESLTSVGYCSFYDCTNLETVDMPQELNSISGGAFYGCTALKSIVIPQGVKRIEGDTFRSCSALEKVVFPETLTSIGMSSFYECNSLSQADIPNSVQNISAYAFFRCNLKQVNIPEGITSLNALVFAYCPLEQVHIPSTVKTIGTWAFGASRLKSVTVPEGVTKIGALAFYGSSMQALILPRSLTDFDDGAFDYFGYNEYVYCYKGSAAESFATEKNVKYKYIGDMDSDKEITKKDASEIFKYINGKKTLSSTDYNTPALSDYDLDEKLTISDVIKLLSEN